MAGSTRMSNRRVGQRVVLALAIAAAASLSGAAGLLRPGSAAAAGPLESGPAAPVPTFSDRAKHDVALAEYLGDRGLMRFLSDSDPGEHRASSPAPMLGR